MNDKTICFLDHAFKPRYLQISSEKSQMIRIESLKCTDKITLYIPNDRNSNITFEGECCRFCMASTSLVLTAINEKEVDFSNIDLSYIYKKFGLDMIAGKEECCSLILKALNYFTN